MNERAATLENKTKSSNEDDGQQNDAIRENAAVNLRVKGMKFTYPTGSRPLDGYTIKRGIGIGGFGEVYFALSDAGKEVALKRIQRNLDIELRGVRQCLNLKHGNLISLWDIRTSDTGESWVIMEYVPGDSLRDAIEAHPNGMPIELMREWFESTCAGVNYLHERGIVHRDLKPGNIFRDDDEEVVKIGDYGLSKFISCSNRDGQTESVGTFHYMAPEIGKGVYGKEIDVYALGIILFEMLTGRVPFEGESSQEIIMKHLTANPDLSGLNEPYRTIVGIALKKDPQNRFSTVKEMLDRLNAPVQPAPVQKVSHRSNRVPPIQPMFIGEQPHYIGDEDEIQFGEIRQVVEAEIRTVKAERVPVSEPKRSPAPVANASAAATATAENAKRVPEEPIARAVHGGWSQVTDWWFNANISTPIKVTILAVAILLLLINSAWLIPVSIGLGLVYLIYYAVRSWLAPIEGAPKAKRLSKAEVAEHVRGQLAKKTVGDRSVELVGSLIASAVACMVLGLLALAVSGMQMETGNSQWAFYAWLVVTSIVGCWGLLATSKVWEHRKGEQLLRRFVMLAMGTIIGVGAFLFAQFLQLNWADRSNYEGVEISLIDPAPFLNTAEPTLLGFIVFFGGLFLILRWWRQADPVRYTRLSIVSTGMCLIWGVVIGQLFHFPLPWSCILAVIISVATQLAAPWLSPTDRQRMVQSGLQETVG